MSSPIAKTTKSGVDRALISVHRRMSHSHRIDRLSAALAASISGLPPPMPARPLRVLDVGCGDMTLIDAIGRQLTQAVEFHCVDIHPCPAELLQRDPRWRRYSCFDGQTLPFAAGEFDVVVLVDVLHHVPPVLRPGLLSSAVRAGRHVVIKDHLERGKWSRQVLRTMDLVGNRGYGVSVPDRYFDRTALQLLLADAGATLSSMRVGLHLYDHLPVLRKLLSPDWQFIAVCEALGSSTS